MCYFNVCTIYRAYLGLGSGTMGHSLFSFGLLHVKKKKQNTSNKCHFIKKKYGGQEVRGDTFPCVNDKAFIQCRY